MKKILIAFAITSLTLMGCIEQEQNNTSAPSSEIQQDAQEQYITASSADNSVTAQFPVGWFENENEHPYDIQYFSEDQRMTTGVFIYKKEDLASDLSSQEMLELQIDDLRSKRENFIVLEPVETAQLDNKILTTAVYSGEKENAKYHYKFTLVEFTDNPDILVMALQVAIPSDWSKNKPVLEKITQSFQVNS